MSWHRNRNQNAMNANQPPTVRKTISLPADWLEALETKARSDGWEFSAWLCACGVAQLSDRERAKLSQRKRGRPTGEG